MIWILLLLVGVTMSLGNAWRLWFRRHLRSSRSGAGWYCFLDAWPLLSARSHIALGLRIVSLGRLTARMENEASWRQCWDRLVPVRTCSLSCGAGTLARVA